MKRPALPPILIDTREQHPYAFAGSRIATLPTGDYSLQGFADSVAVERKSLDDAYASVSSGRDRFRREVERLAQLDFGAVVIEATIERFLVGSRSGMHPHAALHTFLAWSVELRVPVVFAGPRPVARGMVFHLLRHWWRSEQKKKAPLPPQVVAPSGDRANVHAIMPALR